MAIGQIEISDLRNIKFMRFDLPAPGVHILTGANGAGKTTLLTCIERITNRNAFKNNFRLSDLEKFDNYEKAVIRYSNNTNVAQYKFYPKSREWRSGRNAKANSILNLLGYRDGYFFRASNDSERYFVQNRIPVRYNFRNVDDEIKDTMNMVFETNKFQHLSRILIGDGRSNRGRIKRENNLFVLNKNTTPSSYVTERNFSLGEIQVLNLLHIIRERENNALILIDEIETALHPRAQVNLLKYLERQASNKQQTIIISTHSASLIKHSQSLLFLDRDINDHVNVIRDAHPAYVLKGVTYTDDFLPDRLFLVEDIQAEFLLRAMIKRHIEEVNRPVTADYRIWPIGGWPQVLLFADRMRRELPPMTRMQLFFDADVQPNIRPILQKRPAPQSEQHIVNLNAAGLINYLPVTPEEGLINWLYADLNRSAALFQREFAGFGVVDFRRYHTDEQLHHRGRTWTNPRDEAKDRLDFIINRLKITITIPDQQIYTPIYENYVASLYPDGNTGQLHALLGPHL